MTPRGAARPPRRVLTKVLAPLAGEHYVVYQLLRRGVTASLAPPGALEDVLVTSPSGEVVFAGVRVKVRIEGMETGWTMNEEAERLAHPQLMYALVDMERAAPITYIVPSVIVAEAIATSYDASLATPDADGQQRPQSRARRLSPAYTYPVPGYPPGWLNRYRDEWDLLTSYAPDEPIPRVVRPGPSLDPPPA